jgi:hypothetical protein
MPPPPRMVNWSADHNARWDRVLDRLQELHEQARQHRRRRSASLEHRGLQEFHGQQRWNRRTRSCSFLHDNCRTTGSSPLATSPSIDGMRSVHVELQSSDGIASGYQYVISPHEQRLTY